jgi:glycosyltransferase involved in cell wall biosynthesis
MKLALAAGYEIADPRAWSGTPLSLYTALQATAEGDEIVTVNAAVLPGGAPQKPPLTQIDIRASLQRRQLLTKARDAWRNPARSRALNRWLAAEKPDALLQFGGFRTAASGIPYFVYSDSTHELSERFGREHPALFARLYPGRTEADARLAARAVQPIYDEATGIFCMSEWMAQSLQRMGTDIGKLHVVSPAPNWNGAALTVVQKRPPQEPFRLLFVGVDWFHKGGDVVFDALRLLNNHLEAPKYLLDYAGSAQVPHEVRETGFCRVHGFCSKEELSKLYATADLFVMLTRYDCFGIVFLEAMAYGLPCIGRDVCAMPEFIRSGENGERLRGDDPAALAELIEKVLCAENYEAYSRGALAASRKYSWQAAAQRIWKVIRSFAG